MKKAGNLRSYAVCTVVTVLTACAANPLEEKESKATVTRVVSEKLVVTKPVKKKAIVKTVIVSKTSVTQPKPFKKNTTKQAIPKKAILVSKKKSAVRKAILVKPKVLIVTKPKPVITRTKVAKKIPSKPKVIVAKVSPKKIMPKKLTVVKPPQNSKKPAQVIQKPVLQYGANTQKSSNKKYRKTVIRRPVTRIKPQVTSIDPDISFGHALSSAAINRTKHTVRYDGSYVKIGYPWGDVPKAIGVCTDVVIRAYRKLGIDLQQEVHKDISSDFYAYPTLEKWGLTKPDPNIDHRRVYNLQAFFKRHKAELPRSRNPKDYKPGDLVTWMVGPSFPHIGVVVNQPSQADPNRLMISHNIGYGPKVEDILFRFPMTGHYRYTPKNRKINPAMHFAKTLAPASAKKRASMNYTDLLEASRLLIGNGIKRNENTNKGSLLQVKSTPSPRINLAELDPITLKALLNN